MRKPKRSTINDFIALPDSERERVVREIEAETPVERLARSRPLNAQERKQWRRFKSKMGRPRMGKGAKTISLTVEKELLAEADAYARKHGVSRASLVARGLRAVLESAA